MVKNGPEFQSISSAVESVGAADYGHNFMQSFTIEHSRAGDGIIAAWATLQSLGEKGFQSYIAYTLECSDVFRKILPKYGFELINPISLTFAPVFFTAPKDGHKSYNELVREQNSEKVQANSKYMFALTQYMADNKGGQPVDVGFMKSYLESASGDRHSALRIFPMAIDKSIDYCEKLAHIIGQKKIAFDDILERGEAAISDLVPKIVHK
jgi:hypothetical protein